MSKNIQILKLLAIVGDEASIVRSLLSLIGKYVTPKLTSIDYATACEELGGIETKLDIVKDNMDKLQIEIIEDKP